MRRKSKADPVRRAGRRYFEMPMGFAFSSGREGTKGMKVLFYPHSMEVGGSQLNALQLAGAVRERGHEVIVLSEPGPLVERVRRMGTRAYRNPRASEAAIRERDAQDRPSGTGTRYRGRARA